MRSLSGNLCTTTELARYKLIRFEASSEKLDAAQLRLLQETLDADLAAIEEQLEQLIAEPGKPRKQTPRREILPGQATVASVRQPTSGRPSQVTTE